LTTPALAEALTPEQQQEVDALRREGYTKLHLGQKDAALAAFETIVERFPEHWIGYYDRACYHLREQDVEQGLHDLWLCVERGCDDYRVFKDDHDLDLVRKERPDQYALLLERVERTWQASRAQQIREEAQRYRRLLSQGPLFSFDFDLPRILTEGRLQLADLEGSVVLVDLWGTWCPPCRMAVPHLVELGNEYRELGLQVVGINFEEKRGWRDLPTLKRRLPAEASQLHINYPLLAGNQGILAQVPGFRGFPTMLLIDHEGRVRYRKVGYAGKDELEKVVQALLGEKLEADQETQAEPPTEEPGIAPDTPPASAPGTQQSDQSDEQ
jgi:thiol-disulfide isomerase/thioredoxin